MKHTALLLLALGLAACPLAPYQAPDGTLWPSQSAYQESRGSLGISVGDLWCEFDDGGYCRVAWSKSQEQLLYDHEWFGAVCPDHTACDRYPQWEQGENLGDE